MQTILGANGQIADELAKELKTKYTSDIRLVNRNPKKINNTDLVFQANLMDAAKTAEAVKGSEIAYLTVGLPMNTNNIFDSSKFKHRFPNFNITTYSQGIEQIMNEQVLI